MDDDLSTIRAEEAQVLTQLVETGERAEGVGLHFSAQALRSNTDGLIAVIESRTFIRECICRSMQSAFSLPIQTYSEAAEFQQKCHQLPNLILLSGLERSQEANATVFGILSQIAPRIPIIVLGHTNDSEPARTAVGLGAKGYIPVTLGFDIAIGAVRLVLAGGTYVPLDYLLTRSGAGDPPSEAPRASSAVTARELAVVRAIQHGKSNKIIAYELGMCESTVKVHVRRIMKKLNAKNRTDAAIKLHESLGNSHELHSF